LKIRDWGVSHISFVSILASKAGILRVASTLPDETDFTVGAVDETVDSKGYIQPGLGDIGDRLFGTQLS
jgi:uracil phosphoribosyltransferase